MDNVYDSTKSAIDAIAGIIRAQNSGMDDRYPGVPSVDDIIATLGVVDANAPLDEDQWCDAWDAVEAA